MTTNSLPTLRWGIIGTGLISSWFVTDLTIDRPNKKANHIIQAIGSSSVEKGKAFVEKHLSGKSPTVYGSYDELYQDADVDIVYIGTPHAFHRQNCLDAIRKGKHVLCEKPFALSESQAKEVFDEAARQGVFVMEAMWTRFFPLVHKLRDLIHREKIIGDIFRVFCDFSMPMDIASLPSTSRLKNPALGAGSLLDIGIYSITWAILALESERTLDKPRVLSSQTFRDEIDVANSVILNYPDGKQGIATCSTFSKTPSSFCRIEGSKGAITVDGFVASVPASFVVTQVDQEPRKYEFERPGKGFYWEADAVALDIVTGKKQSDIMSWSETLRIMSLLDEVKRQGALQ
jgi:predicted dehydrogenase